MMEFLMAKELHRLLLSQLRQPRRTHAILPPTPMPRSGFLKWVKRPGSSRVLSVRYAAIHLGRRSDASIPPAASRPCKPPAMIVSSASQYARACSRSARISSMCSIPIDSLT